jgi:hypothetical protein
VVLEPTERTTKLYEVTSRTRYVAGTKWDGLCTAPSLEQTDVAFDDRQADADVDPVRHGQLYPTSSARPKAWLLWTTAR